MLRVGENFLQAGKHTANVLWQEEQQKYRCQNADARSRPPRPLPQLRDAQGCNEARDHEQRKIGHAQYRRRQAHAPQAPGPGPPPKRRAGEEQAEGQEEIVVAEPPDISPGIAQEKPRAQKACEGSAFPAKRSIEQHGRAKGQCHIHFPGEEINAPVAEQDMVKAQNGVKQCGIELHRVPFVQNQLLAVPEPLGEGEIKALVRPAESIHCPHRQHHRRSRQSRRIKGPGISFFQNRSSQILFLTLYTPVWDYSTPGFGGTGITPVHK